MVEISNIEISGLKSSIISCRNSMRVDMPDYNDYEEFKKGLNRAKKLAVLPSNTGEDNFLAGIVVSFDIKYPQYFTPELQRYKFLTIICSQSKMHRLCKMDVDYACNKYVDGRTKQHLKSLIHTYNTHQSYENFMRLISNCPLGLELSMRVTTNYRQLKTIYKQRKQHKLQEDWGAFCEFIENLPCANELICGKKE